ncbi:hypothetical protein ACO1MN_16645, partial [Staphylococcus aureus]
KFQVILEGKFVVEVLAIRSSHVPDVVILPVASCNPLVIPVLEKRSVEPEFMVRTPPTYTIVFVMVTVALLFMIRL